MKLLYESNVTRKVTLNIIQKNLNILISYEKNYFPHHVLWNCESLVKFHVQLPKFLKKYFNVLLPR